MLIFFLRSFRKVKFRKMQFLKDAIQTVVCFRYSDTRGLLYIDKKGCEMKREQAAGKPSSGFTNEESPQSWAFSGVLLDQKSKSPLFPWGGAVVTNDSY